MNSHISTNDFILHFHFVKNKIVLRGSHLILVREFRLCRSNQGVYFPLTTWHIVIDMFLLAG